MKANLYYEIDKQTGDVRLPITHADGVIYKDGKVSDVLDSIDCSVLYVSKVGDDSNDGSKDYPLATIAEAVSAADRQDSKNVTIIVSEGEYSFDETLVIESNKNITIIADGDVIFNSLHDMPMASAGNEYRSINGGYEPTWIFINGERRLLASTARPNIFNLYNYKNPPFASIPWYSGYKLQHYVIDEDGNRTNYSSVYANNSNLYGKKMFVEMGIDAADAQMLLQDNLYKRVRYHKYDQWTSKFGTIEKVDAENLLITLRIFNNNWDTPSLTTGSKIVLENIPQILSTFNNIRQTESYTKGTFYYDKDGYVHYKPKDGETIVSAKVATLHELISVKSSCKFVGIKFNGTKCDWFNEEGICPDRQGGYTIEPSIRVYSNDVHFYDCEFTDIEATCIGYYEGTKNGSIRNCHFHHIGTAAVRIGEIHDAFAQEVGVEPEWNTSQHPISRTYVLPENISVENNVVAHYGEVLEQSCGIIMFYTKNCHIRHNDVLFGFYTGITFGYCWCDGSTLLGSWYLTDAHYNRGGDIAYNRVAYVGSLLQDLGCIYGLGRTFGLQIKGNKLSYAFTGADAYGIYCDGDVCDAVVTDNLVFKCTNGIRNNAHGTRNIFKHNATSNVETAFHAGVNNDQAVVTGNIFSQNTTTLKNQANVSKNTISGNLWYSKAGTINVDSFDSNPSYGNPNFADPAVGDFHVTDSTNADIIGWWENTYTAGVLNLKQKQIVETYAAEETRYKSLYGTTL